MWKRNLCLAALLSSVLLCPAAPRVYANAERTTPAGEAVVVLNEAFMSAVVEAIAAQPEGASFPLPGAARDGRCANAVRLVPESEGVRSGVRFRDGRITAPLAFRGSYEAPLLGCLDFEGRADAAFDLRFDREQQTLFARVSIRDVKLKNIPTALGGGLTGLVQDAVDSRLNPVRILRAEQLGAPLPLAGGPALRLRARDISHEVVGQELRLRIFYELVHA